MEAIVLPDDELRRLETRFGAKVRYMGPWMSDGTFGYASVSVGTLEKAAELLNVPALTETLSCIKNSPEPEQAKLFIDVLGTFGDILIDSIVLVYQEPVSSLVNWHVAPNVLAASHRFDVQL